MSEALQAEEARRTLSLDVPRSRQDQESVPMVETVGKTELGYDAVEAQLAADDAPLDERERRVLRLRFEQDLNQYEIGHRLGRLADAGLADHARGASKAPRGDSGIGFT